MKRGWVFVLLILGVGFFSVASADVVSINSGGDGNLILNPNLWIEGFFSKPNRLPIASNLILSSSGLENTTNENLTISYSATDADGDFITNITDWRVNGNSIAVLNMPFDKNVAELTSGAVRDYSSYGNNGTFGGNNLSWVSNCKIGGCYNFTSHIGDPRITGPSFQVPQEYSISVWVKSNGPQSSENIYAGGWTSRISMRIASGGTSPVPGILIYNSTGGGTNSVSITSNDNVLDGDWHNIVATVSKDTYQIKIYYDGVNVQNGTANDHLFWGTTSLNIGSWSGTYGNFNGLIDEFQIFNRALSPEQIKEIYQAGLAGHQVEKMVSQETNKGDSWQVVLTPNDAIMDGTTIYSNTLGIIDSAPEDPSSVTLVSVNGTDESDDDLNCSAYIEDVDNELLDVYVRWYKNSNLVLNYNFNDWVNGTTFSMILDSGNLTLGDVWYCSVRTYDGNDYSSWVNSNELEIVDITPPEVYIISPLSEAVYNYTTLNVDFNVSVIENEEVSMCFYDLNGQGNVSMNELNNSYFWAEPSLGPGPSEVIYWCNDTSNNWGTNSTTFYIEDEAAISIDLSDELSWWVKWNLVSLPVQDLGAIGNNGSGITEYYVNVSATATTVDLYVRADGDLQTVDLDVLGLENETFSYVTNDPYVNTSNQTVMETNYIQIGSGLQDGDVVYLKFFVDAPASQPAGVYQNQLQFKAVRTGILP